MAFMDTLEVSQICDVQIVTSTFFTASKGCFTEDNRAEVIQLLV